MQGMIPPVKTGGLWIREKIPSISGTQPLTRITAVYQPAFFWSASRRVTSIARARLKQTCSIYIIPTFVQLSQIGTGADKREKMDNANPKLFRVKELCLLYTSDAADE